MANKGIGLTKTDAKLLTQCQRECLQANESRFFACKNRRLVAAETSVQISYRYNSINECTDS